MINRYKWWYHQENVVERDEKQILMDMESTMYQLKSTIEVQAALLKKLVNNQVSLGEHVQACEENVAEVKRLLTEHVEFGPGTEFAQNAQESWEHNNK